MDMNEQDYVKCVSDILHFMYTKFNDNNVSSKDAVIILLDMTGSLLNQVLPDDTDLDKFGQEYGRDAVDAVKKSRGANELQSLLNSMGISNDDILDAFRESKKGAE